MKNLARALHQFMQLVTYPVTLGIPMRDRIVWPAQILQILVTAATTFLVFDLTGGNWRHPLTDRHPAAAAILTFFGMAALAWAVDLESRTSERRLAERRDAIRRENEQQSLLTPHRLQVAERDVLLTALSLAQAQIPTEHPEQDHLMDAVARLGASVKAGESVHPDVEELYLHVFGARLHNARHAVAEIVREHGPIDFTQIAAKLREGAPGRPPLLVGRGRLAVLLRDTHDTTKPARWLAPRQRGEQYQHRENATARV